MKKIIKFTAPLLTSFGILIYKIDTIFADGSGFFDQTSGGAPAIKVVSKDPLPANIAKVIDYGLGLLGLIAVAFIIYAGVLMVVSSGEEEGVTKGKKIITYAVIGIVIIVMAYSIVQFVTKILG